VIFYEKFLFHSKIIFDTLCDFTERRHMSTKPPKHTEIDQKELEAILAAVKLHLNSSQYKILENAIKMLIWLQFVVKEKSLSITRLARMLFGKGTENLKKLKSRVKAKNSSDNTDLNDDGPDENPSNNGLEKSSDKQKDTDQKNEAINPSNNVPSEEKSSEEELQDPEKKKGHGRRPLDDYNISKITYIPHDCLSAGQKCPLCQKGTLYDIDPQTILLIRGQPPLKGEAYSAQGLRCHLCQQIFRAAFPKEIATQPKADMSARAIVCLAKYQLGTPLYRLETWQKIMKLPISDSEMWEWTESVALVLHPVHQALMNMAAKGDVIHNDDTTGKILELMEENRQVELAKKNSNHTGKKADKHRKGIFTTALLSKLDGYQIAIYMTGRKNSGENMDELLDLRPEGLKRPVQACDGSSQNSVERHETDVAKCFNHARHNFCELVEAWPKEALAIVEMCNAIFMNDRMTKQMEPDERLKFHQEYSTPIMDKLKSYANNLVDKKKVEPNSSFGKAINYLNNHWEGLTLILRNGNAPLSNNECERAIKSGVLIRKNSYFYKTCWGAFVGDTLLSTIKTCALNGVNPYDYLMAVQANIEDVEKRPNDWLPWNYTQNIEAPFVNVHNNPVEEIFRPCSAGPPIPVEREFQPCLEDKKTTLREKARDFFRRLYPGVWKKKLSTANL
jgi:transposase